MSTRTLRQLVTLGVCATLVCATLAVPQPAQAAWQDNSGDLDYGQDSGTNTLAMVGGVVAIGVGVWAIVHYANKKKKNRQLEQSVPGASAAAEWQAPQIEVAAAGDPEAPTEDHCTMSPKPGWMDRVLEQLEQARAETVVAE